MEPNMMTMARPKRTMENGPALPEIFAENENTVTSRFASDSQENTAPSDPVSSLDATDDVTLTNINITPQGPPPTQQGSRTVTRNPRPRHQTVTLRSQAAEDIDSILEEIRQTEGIPDPLGEYRSRIQLLVSRLEKDCALKIEETKRKYKKEAAQSLVTLAVARQNDGKSRDTFRKIKLGMIDLSYMCRRPHVNDPSAMNGGPDRTLSPENFAEITKERDTLRNELKEQENSYFDLLKRYEKMRENCVTLKDNEENLKETSKETALRLGELMGKYTQLAEHYQQQMTVAAAEIERERREAEESTVGLRLKLKQKELSVSSLEQRISILERENTEYKGICEELLRKAETYDTQSEGESES